MPHRARATAGKLSWFLCVGARLSSAKKIAAVALLLAAVGFVDFITGNEIALSILYLIPVCLTTLWLPRRAAFIVSFIASLIWLCGDVSGGMRYSTVVIPIWNSIVRLAIFCIVADLLYRLVHMTRMLEQLVTERTEALREQMERTQRVIEEAAKVADHERSRIAHDLHDELGQQLAAIGFKAKLMEQEIISGAVPNVDRARELLNMLKQCQVELRQLARGLDPIAIENGLEGAFEDLARRVAAQFSVPCSVSGKSCVPFGGASCPLPRSVATALYRITQEAITNALRHGHPSHIIINFECDADAVLLCMEDDGRGFHANNGATGMGLAIMRHRAESIGFTFEIDSGPGKGTKVICRGKVIYPPPEQGRANGAADIRLALT